MQSRETEFGWKNKIIRQNEHLYMNEHILLQHGNQTYTVIH